MCIGVKGTEDAVKSAAVTLLLYGVVRVFVSDIAAVDAAGLTACDSWFIVV